MPLILPSLPPFLKQAAPSQSAQNYIQQIRAGGPNGQNTAGMGLQLQQMADGLSSDQQDIKGFLVSLYDALTTITQQPMVTLPRGTLSVVPDLTQGSWNTLVLTNNVTIGKVSGPLSASELNFIIAQDATGGRTVTWDADYIGLGGLALTTTANTYSVLRFVIRAVDLRPVLTAVPITGKTWP